MVKNDSQYTQKRKQYLKVCKVDSDWFIERDVIHSWHADGKHIRINVHTIGGPPKNKKQSQNMKGD